MPSMPDTHVVVLAAGKGTRMKSAHPKVLHRVAGRPMIDRVLDAASAVKSASTTLVVGHQAPEIEAALAGRGIRFVLQEPQLGTAHALLQAEPALRRASGTVLMLSGDVPLLRGQTLESLIQAHEAARAAVTVLSAVVDRPYGYGRIIRSQGRLARIVEERDASPAEREIREINSGIYAFALGPLFDSLRRIESKNAQGEYYLPDLIALYRRRRLPVECVAAQHSREVLGINSRTELAEVSRIVRQQKNEELMASGVTIEDPATTYIDDDVMVGPDTVIRPGVWLEGRTVVGAACVIHSGVRIVDSTIGDGVEINNFCVVVSSTVAAGARLGPFAHIRPASEIGERARVGNFVELKKTRLGPGSKANHLAYLGDATIGERVNIGAGTITCNYDGAAKHQTTIEDDVFIGSDTQLVAPVHVGRGAYVAAGSCITEGVPAGALGIARSRQMNKEGWAEKRKQTPRSGTGEERPGGEGTD
jgi:bifunctional UDP-N-acetylglucosamine pyrophosphorylase/glucosamine-1-phosphate N-acetyltransferase